MLNCNLFICLYVFNPCLSDLLHTLIRCVFPVFHNKLLWDILLFLMDFNNTIYDSTELWRGYSATSLQLFIYHMI